jgi:glycosyltransferase involved in cell wall biosynthesis
MKRQIVMVGPFPPPVHGLATTNAAVRDHLEALGAEIRTINTAASSLNRSWLARFGRLPSALRGWVRLATMRGLHRATIYLSVSGGLGQVYEAAFIALARLRGMRVFVRHASFAYIDEPTRLARILIALTGPSAVHVTQSQGMADRLQTIYGMPLVVPISNAVLYAQGEITSVCVRRELRVVGFFSNLSAEKGVFDFLDLMAAIEAEKLPLQAKLAGLYQDAQTERTVHARLKNLHGARYLGPVYGADKEEFLSGIDVLVFPTRYKNETEAKVNHEAMSHGIPVIAYGRGCIPEIVGPDCGMVIDPTEPFVPAALAQIKIWLDDPAAFEAASRGAAQRFAETSAQNERRWRTLLNDLTGNNEILIGRPLSKQD